MFEADGSTASPLRVHLRRGLIRESEEATSHNTGLQLCIAVGYSGREDIAAAARACALRVERGELLAADVTSGARPALLRRATSARRCRSRGRPLCLRSVTTSLTLVAYFRC
jgi:undecaprenyl diphosphate synthase